MNNKRYILEITENDKVIETFILNIGKSVKTLNL